MILAFSDRPFLSFEDNAVRTGRTGYFLAKVEIKDYNVIINENHFDQPVQDDLRNYESIWKIKTVEGDEYIIGCLLNYPYFKKHCKLTAIDLSN